MFIKCFLKCLGIVESVLVCKGDKHDEHENEVTDRLSFIGKS